MPQPRKAAPRKSSGTKRATPSKTKRTAKSPASRDRPAASTSSRTAATGSRSTKARAKPAHKSKHFSRARTRAERVLHDPDATEKLVGAAQKRVEGKPANKLFKVIEELKAMLRLVKAYASGEYRAVSWESMVLVVAALVYLVSPIDVIPDALPFGLADDATVIMFVAGLVDEELDDFMEWERGHGDNGAAGARAPA